MNRSTPGETQKKVEDIVIKLIDIELKNNVRIIVPEFPYAKNFYESKDILVEGYKTQKFLDSISKSLVQLRTASKLRFIRNHLIENQVDLDEIANEIYVEGNDDPEDNSIFQNNIDVWEKGEWKRYFEFGDTFCIRNHTESKKCFETLFPCRACMISTKPAFPIVTTTSRLIRVN